MNKVFLCGNLGVDPEVRYAGSGRPVSNFRMATNKRFTDSQGEKRERTEWHRIVCWGRLAETTGEYLRKGRGVIVEGELQTRAWDDRDGNKRYTTEVVAHNVEFLGSGNQQAQKKQSVNTEEKSSEHYAEQLPEPELEGEAQQVFGG